MILNYFCENFGPFNEEISFSMKPGKVTERFENNVNKVNNNLKISKVAVVVGENAGGKTNFIRSIQYLQYLISENSSKSTIKRLRNKYNNKEQKYNIEIYVEENSKIYTYELILDDISVIKEKLSVRNSTYKNTKNEEIFKNSRINLSGENKKYKMSYELELNKKFIGKEIENLIKNNVVESNKKGERTELFINFFSTIGIDIVKAFREYLLNNIIVSIPEDLSLNIYKKMEKDEKDLEIIKKDSFLEIFKLVDKTIVALEIDEEDPFNESNILRKASNGDIFSIKLKHDSSGVREFFAWSIQLWCVLNENKVLLADEVDKVLNSILGTKIVNYIKNNKHNGQFIFTTHNILHLNTNIFMKEQIYFVTKDIDTLCAEMYSLSDFTDYKYDNPYVYEQYLKGMFGGIPNA